MTIEAAGMTGIGIAWNGAYSQLDQSPGSRHRRRFQRSRAANAQILREGNFCRAPDHSRLAKKEVGENYVGVVEFLAFGFASRVYANPSSTLIYVFRNCSEITYY